MSTLSPHPLALALIDALGKPPARVLDVGTGSGRNARALRAAGFEVDALEDAAVSAGLTDHAGAAYDALISTHAFLHGDSAGTAVAVANARATLRPGGLFYATFASTGDRRFGAGTRIDAQTFAPDDGDEAGIAHVYFDESQLRALLERHFAVASIEEVPVDAIVGRWAHALQPSGSIHWFVRASARIQ